MKRLFVLTALLTVAVAPMSVSPVSATTPYTLHASGPWRSNDGLFSGTWDANLNLAGYDLSGTANFIGLPGVASGNLSGTWDLSMIGFGVMFIDQELASFTGGLQ